LRVYKFSVQFFDIVGCDKVDVVLYTLMNEVLSYDPVTAEGEMFSDNELDL